MSLVNRAISSDGALVGKARQIEVDRAAEEHVADVEEGQLHDVGDQHFLEEHEEALERDAQHDQPDQQQQGLEALVGQIAVDIRLDNLASIEHFVPGRRSLCLDVAEAPSPGLVMSLLASKLPHSRSSFSRDFRHAVARRRRCLELRPHRFGPADRVDLLEVGHADRRSCLRSAASFFSKSSWSA